MPRDKLGVVLLIGSQDSKDCCAKNYERTVFRDKKVIKFTKQNTVSYRIDRSNYTGARFYKNHSLNKKKPALLLFDSYGDLLYSLQDCEDPKIVVKRFKSGQQVARRRESLAAKNAKKIKAIQSLVKEKQYPQALSLISRIKTKNLTRPLRDRLKGQYRAVSKVASKKLRVARKLVKKKKFAKAIKTYQDVVKRFGRIKSAKKKARAGVERARKLQAKQGDGKVSSRGPEAPGPAALVAGTW